MATISLCMIVKNEEDVIARCLDTVKELVDEIIIVDTGSTDSTKTIVSTYTNKIYDFQWIDDFSAARNYAFSLATQEYILWLDADDVLLEVDQIKFKKLKETLNPEIDLVMMKYNAGFDSSGNITLSYYRERLVKRAKNYLWKEPVHECLETYGKIVNVDVAVTHKKEHGGSGNRNLKIYENNIAKGVSLSPRGLYYYARELYYHKRYTDAITYFNKFLSTNKGWVEDCIGACYHLALCYQAIKKDKAMFDILLRSFRFDTPRAEICCLLGQYYMDKKEYEGAIVWYKLASQLKLPENSWGFLLHDYWAFIPYLQLCLCYYYLGDLREAIKYNEKAAVIKPDDAAPIHNRSFFQSLTLK